MELFDHAISRTKNSELITSESESQSVSFESDLFKKIETNQSQGVGLRIMHDGQLGFSFSNDFNDTQIIDRALESAQFGEKAHFVFANGLEQFNPESLKIVDNNVKSTPLETMIILGEEIVDKIKKINADIKIDVTIEKETHHISLMTSNGFSQNYKRSFFSVGASGLLAKNDELLNIHKTKTAHSPFSDINEITQPIIEKFQLSQKSASIQTGNYKVLFSPRAFKTLISILTASLNGKAVQKSISPLSHRINEQILSEELTLIDDGTLPGGLSTTPFDGEGTLTQKNTLIEKGVLKTFIFDLQTAGLLNQQNENKEISSTGNASRSYSSLPQPNFRNLIVEPGSESYESMLSSVDRGILVDQFIGAGQSNVLAGEFSMNLELAFKIEKGSLVGRLKDVIMSGNVFDVLNRIVGLGDKTFVEGSGYYPYILLDKLSISAK